LAISKEKKQQMVADYTDRISKSQALILADYRGLTVADLLELRRRLRENKSEFQIIKNTLFKLALEQAGFSVPTDRIQGTIAVSYCFAEVPPVAKALSDFARETEMLQMKGVIFGSQFLDAEGVKALAELPPREVLLAQLLGAVQSPMSSLVTTITAPLRELVQVLKARSEQGQQAAA
jgi:large subunit ribosomal protein L10